MKSDKPKRFSSTVLGIIIIFSAFTILNFTSMNVLADEYWNISGHTVSGTEWYENTTLWLENGDLVIPNGTCLIFGNNVTLNIKNPAPPTRYGIIIEETGTFIINSTNTDTKIETNVLTKTRTYPFLNSGTIDFLGATVERVYGNPSDKINTGGIRNLPGSSCTLENCNIMDGDTHGIFADGNSTNSTELNVSNCTIKNAAGDLMDGNGIRIQGNTEVTVDSVSIYGVLDNGINVKDGLDVTIRGGTVIQKSTGNAINALDSEGLVIEAVEIRDNLIHGISMDNSEATITNVNVHDNSNDGILVLNNSALVISGSSIRGNDGFGIKAFNSVPVIQNNPSIEYNLDGIYIDNIWDGGAKIENNTISNNIGYGIYLNNTNVTVFDNVLTCNGLEEIYNDDFESVTDWTEEGMWHRVNAGEDGAPEWNISNEGDWSYRYGQNATGDYDNGTRNWGNLTSEEIDAHDLTIAYLTFVSWSDVNETSGDERIIQVKNHAVPWVNVTTIESDPMNQWVFHSINITNYTLEDNLQIRFCFDTIDGNDNDQCGWYIDDVSIRGNVQGNKTYGISINNSVSYIYNNELNKNDYALHCVNSTIEISNNTFFQNEIAIISEESSLNVAYNNITDQQFYGIHLNQSTEALLYHNDIFESEGNAILSEGSQVEITECNISDNWSGIHLEDDSNGNVHDNIITFNHHYEGEGGNVKPKTGVNLDHSYAIIDNNLMIDNARSISCTNSGGIFSNNTIVEQPVAEAFQPIGTTAIWVETSSDVTISGNWIASWTYFEWGMVQIESSYNIQILNNSFQGNFIGNLSYNFRDTTVYYTNLSTSIGGPSNPSGIMVRNSMAQLENNVIHNASRNGIVMESSESTIVNNTVTNSTEYGLTIRNSTVIISEDNYICFNLQDGINSYHSSINITDSNISGNNGYGIICTMDSWSQPVLNETIYGPTLGEGNDSETFSLHHGDILNCTIYIDYNGTDWAKAIENMVYTLNYTTGEVNISALFSELEKDMIFHAYYNYTGTPDSIITNNNIQENGLAGIYLGTSFYIMNETVYGPTFGYGNDPSTIELDHDDILDCTLYLDFNGTEWYKMNETAGDYEIDNETGEIYISWYELFEENWTFYAYYNYSDILGNDTMPSLVIFNNVIASNLDDGINSFRGNVSIMNNTISENIGSGIWMEYCMGEISNNTITENHQSSGGGGPPQMSGIDLFDCQGIQISHNNISENHVNVYILDSENITIEWNEMLDENVIPYTGAPTPRGIYSISSQIIASNNTIWGTCFGIDLEDADNETILADNKFYRIESLNPSTGTEIGIRLSEASPILERNLFDGIKDGIKCYENSSAYIHNNTIINCTYDGIYLEWSEAIIIGNNISGNGGWGILSKYAAPQNAGTNGTGLISDNPLIGSNGFGMVTQIWTLKVLVINRTTNASVPWQYVQIDDRYNSTVWIGYTDSQGYTEYIDVSQYELINSTITWNYNPFQVYTEYPGTPTVGIVETNTIMTVYMD